ncbi:Holliday junction branch migration protein RuvA [Schaedlerella arabinosiphila]|uniref:Holliday junction branch migration complex subunit RuvA n=1 Tax=Schaedlerella arabinosiphila TaxID=2044587 RepID=A0A9X5CB71_9FIRM|nr:Holliday junction branch migration protein RuvA [Schaedlerella arabinosiphila]KAI4443933.1 Holliday junction ATP-dependent DNA helicase RuvA [Schaedlerella arabinosiphila]MCI9604213.1 Holliday junction branch migration protein RuvA [Ruminococcus sp.]MCI9632449.1 Holliday junction branch migration protein RuvA [Ruminococcus sp.]NDO71449.1 Holliday junction branch migration protein RuvA [Schaedlerella arabinosiphila]
MISYIRGTLAAMEREKVIVDVQGVGYGVFMPERAMGLLPRIGNEVKLHTYLNVREDAMQLFGFLTRDDLAIFKLLIGVSGIGPKGGLGILSQLSADDLRFAVLAGDVKAISATPGIGKKTAEKLIIELKDKLDLDEMLHPSGQAETAGSADTAVNSVQSEAVQALVALGYGSTESLKAVKKVNLENTTVEEVLKEALKNF